MLQSFIQAEGESLLWIKCRPQSGLALISLLLCSQTGGVLLITVCTFEGSLQFDQFQESVIIMIMELCLDGFMMV